MRKHVAVVCGGWSSERVVSLSSGQEMVEAARQAGYEAILVDARRDLANQLYEISPEVILNAMHGPWGEDGCVQGLFEILNIPYSHSGVLASALAMDKRKSKMVFAAQGMDVAKDIAIDRQRAARDIVLPLPYVIKPVAEGSSLGVLFVKDSADIPLKEILCDDWPYGDDLMAEEYIPGRELTVSVMDDKPLCVTEILTGREYYDFEAKYTSGGSRHEIPANLPDDITRTALDWALRAHKSLGCRGITRSDFRYDESQNRLVIIELNTQPGMTPTSLVPEQAQWVGIDFSELVSWMIKDASCQR